MITTTAGPTTDNATLLLEAAKAYAASGMCIIPAKFPAKEPAVKWRVFTAEGDDKGNHAPPPDDAQLDRWARDFHPMRMIAAVCGKASNGLVVIDFDHDAPRFYPVWREAVGALADGLPLVKTRKGYHVHFRCATPIGNEKLAHIPDADAEDGRLTSIETRGEGGIIIVPPSEHGGGGLYEIVEGDPSATPIIPQAQADALIAAARKLDEAPLTKREIARAKAATVNRKARADLNGEASVIDLFNKVDIREVLRSNGYRNGPRGMMVRPGKDEPASSVLIHDDTNTSFHFSTNDPLYGEHQHDPFSVFCQLDHNGDVKKAVRAAAVLLKMEHKPKAKESRVPQYDPVPSFEDPTEEKPEPLPAPIPAGQLCRDNPRLRLAVIHGLLRETETLNLISASKRGKTYLAIGLGLSVATGRAWLDTYMIEQGDVLYIDAELHPPTYAKRLEWISQGMGIMREEFEGHFDVMSLRGKLVDIYRLAPFFASIPHGRYRLIVLDALYRLIPAGTDENSNSEMTLIYNQIDRYAEQTGAAIVIVHHTSKGLQSGKSVVDVGAGAGAQARATDSHIVLREHEEDNVVVMEGACRSWPPPAAMCVAWEFPLWKPATHLDPNDLRQANSRRSRIADQPEVPKAIKTVWTPEKFVETFITGDPQTSEVIIAKAQLTDMSERKAKQMLTLAEAGGSIHRWTSPNPNQKVRFATVAQPITDPGVHS